MKWKYKSLMFLILILFCVGGVCATDPDNNTNINNGTVINNGSNDLNYTVNNGTVINNGSNDLNYTVMELVKERFKDKIIGSEVLKMIPNPDQKNIINNYYEQKLEKLRNNIITNLNNIDNEIDKDLNRKVNVLEKKSNLLNCIDFNKINSLLNNTNNSAGIQQVNKIAKTLKVINGSINSIINHSKLIMHYLDTINGYRLIKEMLNNNSLTDESLQQDIDNITLDYLKNRVDELNRMVDTLNSMRNYLDSVSGNLKSMVDIINQQIKIKSC